MALKLLNVGLPSYLRRRLAFEEGIVTFGVTLSRCVCARRIRLGGEGNAMYPMLSSLELRHLYTDFTVSPSGYLDIVISPIRQTRIVKPP